MGASAPSAAAAAATPEYAFFAVYDGHSGAGTCESLAQMFHFRLAAGLGLVSQPLRLCCRREVTVRGAAVEQPMRVGVVPLHVGPLVHDLFVPREAEPLEAIENGAGAFVRASGAIGVFDAQEEVAAELLRVQPVEQGSARAADMEKAGR